MSTAPDPVLTRLLSDLPDTALVVVVGGAAAAAAVSVVGRGRVVVADPSAAPGGGPGAWEDGTVDAVVLAARFDYWGAGDGIREWWPKVRPGGWIGGPGHGVWTGLTRAVADQLGSPDLVHGSAGLWRIRRVRGRDLGPLPPWPKIGVVTPHYAADPAHLLACVRSVRAQTVPSIHYLVCDGPPPAWQTPLPDVRVTMVPGPHHDVGNAARAVGAILAAAEGCEAVAFLDADNWYEPDHLAAAVSARAGTGAAVVSAGRTLWGWDDTRLGPCPEVDGERFVDTNCLCLFRQAFGLIGAWAGVPPGEAAVGDRFVWAAAVGSGLHRAHTGRPTVNYRTPYKAHYDHFGIPAPAGAKVLVHGPGGTRTVRAQPD